VISELPLAGDIKESRDLVDVDIDLEALGKGLFGRRHLDSSKSNS
jgi:hypothetical protein